MDSRAYISEIFSSLQGEGPHTGEPMTFVRFAGCGLSCRWCDTKHARENGAYCKIETPPRSRSFVNQANPLSVEQLSAQLRFFTDLTISVTGGEPLLQADFIAKWLSEKRPDKKVLLETNGICHKELLKIGRFVDIFSVDIKLPSSAGISRHWEEHRAFLHNALSFGKETYVKMVVTKDTLDADIQEAIKVVSSVNKFIPVVLQPASGTDSFDQTISDEKLLSFARLCGLWLTNVSTMKQAHKEMGIL